MIVCAIPTSLFHMVELQTKIWSTFLATITCGWLLPSVAEEGLYMRTSNKKFESWNLCADWRLRRRSSSDFAILPSPTIAFIVREKWWESGHDFILIQGTSKQIGRHGLNLRRLIRIAWFYCKPHHRSHGLFFNSISCKKGKVRASHDAFYKVYL